MLVQYRNMGSLKGPAVPAAVEFRRIKSEILLFYGYIAESIRTVSLMTMGATSHAGCEFPG